jgi:proteasome lid subunit RPN8/RPN11
LFGSQAHDDVIEYLGAWCGVERGGLLLGPLETEQVTIFVPDRTGESRPGSFTFDHARLNAALAGWLAQGFDCKGFAHSHPPGCTELSDGDLEYVRGILALPANDVTEVLMPVVCDGRMHGFIVYPDRPNEPVDAEIFIL